MNFEIQNLDFLAFWTILPRNMADFLKKVAEGYKKIALNNEDRCKLVDCNQKDIISVHNEIVEIFNLHYGKDVL